MIFVKRFSAVPVGAFKWLDDEPIAGATGYYRALLRS